ncbi:Uncharacterized protein dnm_004000 [Desulfonema magnum]|uniref:Uncharacterized protein n=1 Tax=Desulfonema magnum TaxID=45655 RepID=A0A975GK62_9BACT|nr:Uncharacterized protein dnm_004000 [Desulfonema magnum]
MSLKIPDLLLNSFGSMIYSEKFPGCARCGKETRLFFRDGSDLPRRKQPGFSPVRPVTARKLFDLLKIYFYCKNILYLKCI